MARIRIEIPGITRNCQGEQEVYIGSISAETLVKVAVHLPFGKHPSGVNRKLTVNRAKEIAKLIESGKSALMRTTIAGDLRSGEDCEWTYDEETRTLVGEIETDDRRRTDGCYMILDDGLHRTSGLEMVSGEIRAQWTFPIFLTINGDWDMRAEAFLQQEKGKRQDLRHMLALYDRLGRFPNRATRVAYQAAKELNTDPSSPFKGKINFDVKTRKELSREVIDVKSLFSFLKEAVGTRSNLNGMLEEDQVQVFVNVFRAAASAWDRYWGGEDHPLGRPLGWGALIILIARGRNFLHLTGGDYSFNRLEKVFTVCGKGFRWADKPRDKQASCNWLADKLNDHLIANLVQLDGNGGGRPMAPTTEELPPEAGETTTV